MQPPAMNILNTRPLLERLVFCVCLSLVARICALPRVSTAMTWLVLNAAVLTGLLGCVAYMLAAYPVENKKDDANEKEVAIPLVVAVEAPSANSVKDAKDSSNIVSAENTQEYSIRALSLNPPSLVDDNLHDCDHTLVDSDSLLTPSATRQDVFTKLVLDEFFFQNSHASSEKDAIFPLIDSKPTNPPPVAFVKPESPINPISVFIKPPAMYELVGGDTQSFSSLSTITTDSIFSEVADLGDLFDKSESSFELTPFSVESSAPVVTTMPNRWESQSLPSYQFAAGIQPVQPANRKTVSFAETEKRDSAINIIDDPPIPAINNISMFSSRLSRDLTVLKLSKMGLESFPVTLYQLKGLQEIDLCNNKISRLDPQFGKFTDLTVCDLSWNALGSIDYDLFSEMRGLSWLDISHNHLTKLPSCLGYNTELMLLRCGGNSLSTAFQALLGPMANVEPTSLSRRPAVDSLDRLYKNFVRRLQCHLRDEYDLTRGVHYRKQKPAANPPLSSVFPDFRTYSIPQLVSVDGLDVGGFGFSKRQKILRELLETEQAYVSNLQTLYDLYYQPLSNLLTPCQIAGVFGNFNVILEIHRDEILPGLQKRVAENRGVGDLFEALNPRFEVYAAYINHHDIANSLLAWVQTGSEIIGSGSVTSGRFQFPKHTKDDQFSVYALDFNFEQVEKVLRVMQVAKAHKKHAQINMGSYLIMPIQRLPRYLMLLDALAKTAPNMPSLDDVAVVRAYKHLKTIIADLNESKRKCEAQNEKVGVMLGRVRRLNYSLGVGYMTNTPISRVFVCASDSNPIRLVKYVELKHELNAGQVTSAFTLDMYGCYEYKFKEKQNSRLSYDIDTGGAIDRYDLAGVIGKRAFLILFNDLLLVCTTKREQYCVLRCVRIHSSRSRQAEFLAVSRLEGILRITDGACVVYIRGSLEFVRDWTKKINGIKQD